MPSFIDLTGRTIGRWTVLERVETEGCVRWVCKCSCALGTIREVVASSLHSGTCLSCGCLKRDTDRDRMLHDFTGETIGRLYVECQTKPLPQKSRDGTPGKKMRMWKVWCSCGNEAIIQTQTLHKQKRSGYGSCGCWNKQRKREEREKKTPPYYHYLSRIKNSAGQRNKNTARESNIKVSISYEELIALIPEGGKGNCHYCDDLLIWLPYDRKNVGHRPNQARQTGHNFDRKNNEDGYHTKNLVPCCGDCNRTRGDRFTYEEFMLLSPYLKKIRVTRLENVARLEKASGMSIDELIEFYESKKDDSL